MKRILLAALLLLAISESVAAQQSCLATTGTAQITSDPFVTGANQPTSCTVYKAGVSIASGATVASSTIPTSNATVCTPASATYVPGPATNVSCLVTIPAQPVGSVTLTMTASSAAGEGPQSAPFTFTSVGTLPVLPSAPTNLRLVP